MAPELSVKRFQVDDPDHFRLAAVDPGDNCGLDLDNDESKSMLVADIRHLAGLQERLYAEDRWAVLVILQGRDAGGQEGEINDVMSGLHPQGCGEHSLEESR